MIRLIMNKDVITSYSIHYTKLYDKFIYAKTLFKGSLSDCLAYPNAFKTTIPGEYNLPELDGNTCEGVVIRPAQPHFLRNGSRVIIKNKNEKWAENNNYIDKASYNFV